jgi:hypothetical protein
LSSVVHRALARWPVSSLSIPTPISAQPGTSTATARLGRGSSRGYVPRRNGRRSPLPEGR